MNYLDFYKKEIYPLYATQTRCILCGEKLTKYDIKHYDVYHEDCFKSLQREECNTDYGVVYHPDNTCQF